uniref:C2H2-type domain-containing protein n=1 Tax=Lepeophtheirus salmonis TaxID=72036 RepID=A0A0K2U8E7_LEPSM
MDVFDSSTTIVSMESEGVSKLRRILPKPIKDQTSFSSDDTLERNEDILSSSLLSNKNKKRGKYNCSWGGCPKSYNNRNTLIEHERQHTGERPFICQTCRRAFFRILDLKKHTLLKVCKS